MIAEKPGWVRHEGMQIFSIDVQPGGLRFATGGGDHKVCFFSLFECFFWFQETAKREIQVNSWRFLVCVGLEKCWILYWGIICGFEICSPLFILLATRELACLLLGHMRIFA